MVLSNDIAALVGVVCEAVLWGAYAVLFLLSIAFLTWRRRTQDRNIPMIFATCLLFSCCTTHFALEFNHFYTTLRATGVPNFADETHQLFGADLLIPTIDLMGDAVLLYRCWLVWGGNFYVIILPTLTALAGFACAVGSLGLFDHVSPTAPVPPASIVPLGVAGYALPLVTNVCITALIVGRILHFTLPAELRVTGADGAAAPRISSAVHVHQAASIVVESGLLYLVVQLVFVVLFGMGHPAEAILAVIAVQTYGIAPTLIFFRVGLGISAEHTTQLHTGTLIQFNNTASTSPRKSRAAHRRGLFTSSRFTSTGGTRTGSATDVDVDAEYSLREMGDAKGDGEAVYHMQPKDPAVDAESR